MSALRVVKTTVHWTKRPENKAKLRLMTKRAARTRRKGNKARKATLLTPTSPANASGIPQDTFAYALGHVECWIEAYAKSAGVPSEALAAQLGKVLQIKSRG